MCQNIKDIKKISNRLGWKYILKITTIFFTCSFFILFVFKFILPTSLLIYINLKNIISCSTILALFAALHTYQRVMQFNNYFLATEEIEKIQNPIIYYKQIELDYKAFMEIKLKQIELIKSFTPTTIFLYSISLYINNNTDLQKKLLVFGLSLTIGEVILILGFIFIASIILLILFFHNEYVDNFYYYRVIQKEILILEGDKT